MTTTRGGRPPGDFGELVDRHQTEILRYLRRLTDDPTVAEDLWTRFSGRSVGFPDCDPIPTIAPGSIASRPICFSTTVARAVAATRLPSHPSCPATDRPPRPRRTAHRQLPPCAWQLANCLGDNGRRSFSVSCTVSVTVTSVPRSGAPRRRRGLTSTRRSAGYAAHLRQSGGDHDLRSVWQAARPAGDRRPA